MKAGNFLGGLGSAGCLFIAFICFAIAAGTSNWTIETGLNVGPYRICNDGSCGSVSESDMENARSACSSGGPDAFASSNGISATTNPTQTQNLVLTILASSSDSSGNNPNCKGVNEIEVTRAFVVAACVFAAIGWILSLVTVSDATRIGGIPTMCCAFLAFVLGLIAMSVWVDAFGTGATYGYSFGLEIVGWVFSLFACFTAICIPGFGFTKSASGSAV